MSIWMGFFLIVMGGILQGSFFLGLKYAHPWKWENIWSVYSFCGLLLLPVGLAAATAPRLGEVMRLAPGNELFHVFAYGAGWGIGSVFAGLGVARLGMAIGVSVILAVCSALGCLVPLIMNTPDLVFTRKGLLIIVAVGTLLLGVFLVAVGGKKRDLSQRTTAHTTPQGSLAAGLVLCILSGIFSSMLNYAFAFSQSIAHAATHLGTSQFGSINAVWMIALAGGFIPNGIYAGYLLTWNKTWSAFALPRTRVLWWVGVLMALLWTGGLVLYGRGGVALGQLGPVIGYPVFLACAVVAASLWGFATGEWRCADAPAKGYMIAGCVVLMAAAGILGIANQV
jgi:L-rhamnose-H+ transport protein